MVIDIFAKGVDNRGEICYKNETAVGDTLYREPKGKNTEQRLY